MFLPLHYHYRLKTKSHVKPILTYTLSKLGRNDINWPTQVTSWRCRIHHRTHRTWRYQHCGWGMWYIGWSQISVRSWRGCICTVALWMEITLNRKSDRRSVLGEEIAVWVSGNKQCMHMILLGTRHCGGKLLPLSTINVHEGYYLHHSGKRLVLAAEFANRYPHLFPIYRLWNHLGASFHLCLMSGIYRSPSPSCASEAPCGRSLLTSREGLRRLQPLWGKCRIFPGAL